MKYRLLCLAIAVAFGSSMAWADEDREDRHDREKQKISKKINAANIAVNKEAIAAIQLTPGPQGATGATGAQGSMGLTGAAGATGAQGSIGLTGAAGTNGTDGATGSAGADGTNGTNGVDGATGAQGPIGLTGAAGTNGADGATGAQGPIGLTGAAGTNGTDGATGAQGQIGLTGATGTNGADGATGAAGVDGIDGGTGATGFTGAAGQQGPTGAQGPAGADGAFQTSETLRVAICGLYDDIGAARPAICPYAVGDTGPAGGIVFHVSNGGLHGLELGPQMGPATWGCQNTPISGAHTVDGAVNTAAILVGCATSGIAARVADAYISLNGSTGWFLPSVSETYKMFLVKGILGLTSQVYYTSNEYSAAYGRKFHFIDGNVTGQQKQNEAALFFRPVRAF